MPNIYDTMNKAASWAIKKAKQLPLSTKIKTGWNNFTNAAGEFINSEAGKDVATGVQAALPILSSGNHIDAGDGIMGLGAFASNFNPIAGAILSGYGHLMNEAFGSNVNWDNVNRYENNLLQYSRPNINAKDNTQLLNQINNLSEIKSISRGEIGTQGWFNHDVDSVQNELNMGLQSARGSRARLVDDAVSNVDKLNDARIAANYAAFGGPLSNLDPLLKKKFPDEPSIQQQMEYRLLKESVPDMPAFYPYDFESRTKAQRAINAERHRQDFEKRMQERAARKQRVLEKLDEFDDKYLGNRFIKRYESGPKIGDFYTREFGGPLYGYMSDGAIAYDMAKDSLMIKMMNAQNKGEQQPMNTFAAGGILSDNFTNGVTTIGAGGTHEKNPYAGVPMGIAEDGQPNLVEEGEAIYKDYVFSNRLKVPKAVRSKYKLRGPKEMTFAEAFINAQKESEERENDPISKNGLDNIAMILAQAQEEMRTKNNSRKKSQGGHLFSMGANLLRFAEPAGNLFAVMSDARGKTNNPAVFDYIPDYMPLSFTPIGEYVPELKLDTRYAANQQAQQAAATRNAIMNTTAPSKFAALLAADYNAQNTYGNLLRDAELAEYENLMKARTFNRATNQFNSETGLKTIADDNQQKLAYAQAKLAQAKTNVDETNATMGAKAANIKALTTSLANIGREMDAYDWRDMLMRAGVFGTLSEKPSNWSDKQWQAYQESLGIEANGGKLKKKRRGFTY